MSSEEFPVLWKSLTHITLNLDPTNVFRRIRSGLRFISLRNFKLRFKKCLRNSSHFSETHQLTLLQTEAQQMSSSGFAFVWNS